MRFSDEHFMQLALAKAQEGVNQGGSPFGACLVKDGEVLACAHNQVLQDTDITAHAEVTAIREACRKLRSIDLAGCVIYSTCEPCPMCFSAIHWAKIDKIVFGASIEDARNLGFSELSISNLKMKEGGRSPVVVSGPLLKKEALDLFQAWSRRADRRVY